MRSLLAVLLLAAAPAQAITYRVDASITECLSPEISECDALVGRDLGGRVILRTQFVDGPLVDRFLLLGDNLPGRALAFRLGIPDDGERFAGLHFNEAGELDRWFFGILRPDPTRIEVASFGVTWATPDFVARGPGGTISETPVAPIPVPAAGLMLVAGFSSLLGFRWLRGRRSAQA